MVSKKLVSVLGYEKTLILNNLVFQILTLLVLAAVFMMTSAVPQARFFGKKKFPFFPGFGFGKGKLGGIGGAGTAGTYSINGVYGAGGLGGGLGSGLGFFG